jgi:hypothetical protein
VNERRRLTWRDWMSPGAALAAVLVAAIAGGCGQQSSQRPAVARYVTQVSTIESGLATPLGAVTESGSLFSQQQAAAGDQIHTASAPPEQTLRTAYSQIRELGARLAAIRTPPAAEHLRALLLELIDGQAAMTRQVAELVAFLPRYNAVLASLGPETKQLEAVLSQQSAYGAAAVSAVYAAKAAALRRFQAETGAAVSRLRRLRPPAVSRPGYSAQLASLQGMSTSAGRLAAALATGAPTGIGPLLAQFDRAAARGNSEAVQKAEIAAARAYDSSSGALDALSQKVELERLRLADTLQ